MQSNDQIGRKIENLKGLKSAYILEARALTERGLDSPAMAWYSKAAEMELELAGAFQSLEQENNTKVSLLSAGSCFALARQFRRAVETLERVAGQFPEADELIAQHKGKDDVSLTAGTPGLQALVDLLVHKGLIGESEWATAFRTP